MPRKKKPKAGDEAACPQCRKLVALIRNDQGFVVLRVHHVVANSGNGYDVNECGSSGHPPASPDEVAEGDRWQDKAPQRPGKPTAIGSTAMRAATVRQTVDVDAMTSAVSSATEGVSSLGEAIREATESIVRAAAATQDDFTLTEEHVLTTEQMADVMRASINGYAVRQMMSTSTVPEEPRPSYVEVNGHDITDAISGPIQINYVPHDDTVPGLIGRVLVEVRQAYIDIAGAPPTDADMSLEENAFTDDMRTLTLRMTAPSGRLSVSTAISPSVVGTPGYAEEIARQTGEFVRNQLRMLAPRCEERHFTGHGCGEPAGAEHVHRCHVPGCRCHWRTPEPEEGTCP